MKLRRRRRQNEDCHSVLCHPPARPRPESCSCSTSSSCHHFHSLSLHPLHQLASFAAKLAATNRESDALQLSLPSCPLLPSFFIKLLKQQGVEGRTVAGAQLADPAVLLNDNRARPARRTLASSPNRVAAAPLRFQWHLFCGGWSHRKTKYENELSCFITFTDE